VGLGGLGGLTTGGTTTGGTTGGGVTTGGTTAGGVNTGGTTTGTGMATVTVTGLDFTGGFGNVPGPVGFDVGGVDGVDGVDGIDPGLGTVDGVTEPAMLGVGFTEGVGTPVAPGLRCFGTMMSGLPPGWVGDPKLEPATG
jgi:hypothetical protein